MKLINSNSASFGSVRFLSVRQDESNPSKTNYDFRVTKEDSTKYEDIRPRGISGYSKERLITLELERSGENAVLRVLSSKKTGSKYPIAWSIRQQAGEVFEGQMKKFNLVRSFILEVAQKNSKSIALTKKGKAKKIALAELKKSLEFFKK